MAIIVQININKLNNCQVWDTVVTLSEEQGHQTDNIKDYIDL